MFWISFLERPVRSELFLILVIECFEIDLQPFFCFLVPSRKFSLSQSTPATSEPSQQTAAMAENSKWRQQGLGLGT